MSEDEQSPREFLETRRELIVRRLEAASRAVAEAEAQREELRRQLFQVEAALQVMVEAPEAVEPSRPTTIKEGVLRVLARVPGGMSAIGILERLRTDFGMDYPRSSLSPQLSRLKGEGKVSLQHGLWHLVRDGEPRV